MTMEQVRDAWHDKLEAYPPVMFFTPDNQCLTEGCTVSQALLGSATPEVLVLRAAPKLTFELEIFGYENSLTTFEAASLSTPSSVRQQISEAVGIYTEDYRICCDGVSLNPEQPFSSQGLVNGAKLTVDLQLTVHIDMEQSEGVERRTVSFFGSNSVGDLRQDLDFDHDTVLVVSAPFRRVLKDPLHLCHIVSDVMDLHLPLQLFSEKKKLITFEPLGFPDLRQQAAVALSSSPLDLYEELRDQFEMKTEFQLTVDGKVLEKFLPLIDQDVDRNTVIHLDILRSCNVRDEWADLLEIRWDDIVFIYSTESPNGLYLRDAATNDQILMLEGLDLNIFGSMLDVFGPITGRRKSLLLLERDVERSLPVQLFGEVIQKRAWARTLMLDVVPKAPGLRPKEIMSYGELMAAKRSLHQLRLGGETLIALDPSKVVVSCDKKLHIHRFARGSTHLDVLTRMRQLKGCYDLGLKKGARWIADQQINSRLDLELYLLASQCRYKTKLTVSLDSKSYGCWFEADKVCLKDIFIKVGKQAKVSPRTLFCRQLFCVGCGRKMSQEEESFQSVPSDCCRVRSLELTDRKGETFGKGAGGYGSCWLLQENISVDRSACAIVSPDRLLIACLAAVGMQTASPRNVDEETYTLWPEERGKKTSEGL